MSMRRQLYEWQINRQTNGYPLVNPTDGTTFEQIAGIPFSIFTGGIGNNITMPAATTATQFVAIDNLRCSPSWFLSGAAALVAYNQGAKNIGSLEGSDLLDPYSNLDALQVDNSGPGITFDLPAPTTNSGSGTATFRFQVPVGAGQFPTLFQTVIGDTNSGFKAGDVLTWNAAAIDASVPVTAGAISFATGTCTLTIQEEILANPTGAAVVATDFRGTAVAGSTPANPLYIPSEANVVPQLSFQTTNINPFTSIAGPMMFMQLLINTTSYFNETDGTVGPGLPGTASPCPEMASCRSTFDFESPVYILPGQQWDVQVTVYNDSRAFIGDSTKTYNFSANDSGSTGVTTAEDLCCLVQYTLYDGPDALIASKLVEMGVAVRPENVDWYKRQLLEGTI